MDISWDKYCCVREYSLDKTYRGYDHLYPKPTILLCVASSSTLRFHLRDSTSLLRQILSTLRSVRICDLQVFRQVRLDSAGECKEQLVVDRQGDVVPYLGDRSFPVYMNIFVRDLGTPFIWSGQYHRRLEGSPKFPQGAVAPMWCLSC